MNESSAASKAPLRSIPPRPQQVPSSTDTLAILKAFLTNAESQVHTEPPVSEVRSCLTEVKTAYDRVLNYEGEEEKEPLKSLDGKKSETLFRMNAPCSTTITYAVAVDVVMANLRTHLGSPGQTLHSFEVPLSSNQAIGLARSRTLLQFLWHLEKLILHASVGGLDSPFPKDLVQAKAFHPSITFFTANKSVCQTWLSKIRHKVQSLASSARLHTYASFYSEAALEATSGARINFDQGPDGYVGDAEGRVARYVEALISRGDSDQIYGLKSWLLSRVLADPRNTMSASNVSHRLSWIDSANAFARNQFEQTAKELVKLLKMSEFIWGMVRAKKSRSYCCERAALVPPFLTQSIQPSMTRCPRHRTTSIILDYSL